MKLIGYPKAGVPWVAPRVEASVYSLIAQGLRVGVASGHGDITGAQGTGHGARGVRDELGELLRAAPLAQAAFRGVESERVTVRTSAGTGSSVLRRKVGVYRRGPRKGQAKFRVVERKLAVRGRVIGKAARGTGRGCDTDRAAMLAIEAWLSPLLPCSDKPDTARATERARILSEIGREQSMGARLIALGERAAARQARRLVELRGVRASDTSVADAASDAVAGLLLHVRRLDKASEQHWRGCGADASARCACPACGKRARFVRVLAMYAGRAAFNSLCAWSRVGMTGDNTSTAATWCEFVADALGDLVADDDTASGAATWDTAGARWRVVRWVFNAGFRAFVATLPAAMRGTARASAVNGARRRCRVIGSVLFGADIASACVNAGFNSAKAFQASCAKAGFWRALRAARLATLADVPGIAIARGWQRAHAIDAAQASRDLRALGSAGAVGDVFNTDTQRARGEREV